MRLPHVCILWLAVVIVGCECRRGSGTNTISGEVRWEWDSAAGPQAESNALIEFPITTMGARREQILFGLKSFPEKYISLGVTQTLDEWQQLCLANSLRLRTMPGEYPYTRDTMSRWTTENVVHDFDLCEGDALIISAPFSATGHMHPLWNELMGRCRDLSIPVFVDCAFFGTCGHVEVNLDHPAIQSVAFSTTKGLGCGNWRAGICFSKVLLPHLALQYDRPSRRAPSSLLADDRPLRRPSPIPAHR